MANSTVNATALDDGFLQEYAGEGIENFVAGTVSTSYLGMVQPDSGVESDECPAGTWRNSASGASYGHEVEVIVLDFNTVWSERESDEPYRTVNRYQPNSIEVQIQQLPRGKKGYPKMINPDTGNEIQELYVYALFLVDHPEDSPIIFSPTVGSMKTCRQWNTSVSRQILSNGAKAPIFGYRWKLTCDLVPNPKQPSRNMAKFVGFEKAGVTPKDLFMASLKPVLMDTRKSLLRIAQGEPLEEPLDDSEDRNPPF